MLARLATRQSETSREQISNGDRSGWTQGPSVKMKEIIERQAPAREAQEEASYEPGNGGKKKGLRRAQYAMSGRDGNEGSCPHIALEHGAAQVQSHHGHTACARTAKRGDIRLVNRMMSVSRG